MSREKVKSIILTNPKNSRKFQFNILDKICSHFYKCTLISRSTGELFLNYFAKIRDRVNVGEKLKYAHENITLLRLFNLFDRTDEDNNNSYIVYEDDFGFEFTFLELHNSRKYVSEILLRNLANEIYSTLRGIHQNGETHRNITMSAILLGERCSRVKLDSDLVNTDPKKTQNDDIVDLGNLLKTYVSQFPSHSYTPEFRSVLDDLVNGVPKTGFPLFPPNSEKLSKISFMEDRDIKQDIIQLIELFYSSLVNYRQRGAKYKNPKDMLLNFEEVCEKFHKLAFVKETKRTILQLFYSEIQTFFGQLEPDSNFDFIIKSPNRTSPQQKFLEEILKNRKFLTFRSKLILRTKHAVDGLLQFQSPVPFEPSSPKSSVASSTAEWDRLFSYDPNATLPSPQLLKRISKNLSLKNDRNVRLSAMEDLLEINISDLLCSEHWKTLLKQISSSLGDPYRWIVERMFHLHCELFRYSPPEQSVQVCISLVDHLCWLFESNSEQSFSSVFSSDESFFSLFSGIDEVSDPIFENTLRKIKLLLFFHDRLSQFWLSFTDLIFESYIKKLFQLVRIKFLENDEILDIYVNNKPIFEYSRTGSTSNVKMKKSSKKMKMKSKISSVSQKKKVILDFPLLYISILDTEAKWGESWMRERNQRKKWVRKYKKFFLRMMYVISTFDSDIRNYKKKKKKITNKLKMKKSLKKNRNKNSNIVLDSSTEDDVVVFEQELREDEVVVEEEEMEDEEEIEEIEELCVGRIRTMYFVLTHCISLIGKLMMFRDSVSLLFSSSSISSEKVVCSMTLHLLNFGQRNSVFFLSNSNRRGNEKEEKEEETENGQMFRKLIKSITTTIKNLIQNNPSVLTVGVFDLLFQTMKYYSEDSLAMSNIDLVEHEMLVSVLDIFHCVTLEGGLVKQFLQKNVVRSLFRFCEGYLSRNYHKKQKKKTNDKLFEMILKLFDQSLKHYRLNRILSLGLFNQKNHSLKRKKSKSSLLTSSENIIPGGEGEGGRGGTDLQNWINILFGGSQNFSSSLLGKKEVMKIYLSLCTFSEGVKSVRNLGSHLGEKIVTSSNFWSAKETSKSNRSCWKKGLSQESYEFKYSFSNLICGGRNEHSFFPVSLQRQMYDYWVKRTILRYEWIPREEMIFQERSITDKPQQQDDELMRNPNLFYFLSFACHNNSHFNYLVSRVLHECILFQKSSFSTGNCFNAKERSLFFGTKFFLPLLRNLFLVQVFENKFHLSQMLLQELRDQKYLDLGLVQRELMLRIISDAVSSFPELFPNINTHEILNYKYLSLSSQLKWNQKDFGNEEDEEKRREEEHDNKSREKKEDSNENIINISPIEEEEHDVKEETQEEEQLMVFQNWKNYIFSSLEDSVSSQTMKSFLMSEVRGRKCSKMESSFFMHFEDDYFPKLVTNASSSSSSSNSSSTSSTSSPLKMKKGLEEELNRVPISFGQDGVVVVKDPFLSCFMERIMGNNHNRSDMILFLKNFVHFPESCYLWYLRGTSLTFNELMYSTHHHSKSPIKKIKKKMKKGFDPVSVLLPLIEWILSEEYPNVLSFYQVNGISISLFVCRWVSQFFVNYLEEQEIKKIFLLVWNKGLDVFLYVIVSLLVHLKEEVEKRKEKEVMDRWIFCSGEKMSGFSVKKFAFMYKKLQNLYRNVCLKKLLLSE